MQFFSRGGRIPLRIEGNESHALCRLGGRRTRSSAQCTHAWHHRTKLVFLLFEHNCFSEMRSGSERDSYLKHIHFCSLNSMLESKKEEEEEAW